MSSSLLTILTAGAGVFTVGLGVAHVAIPSILRYAEAIGTDVDRPGLGRIRVPGVPYDLRRADLRGIVWVMSNAASYVLVTIGVVDLAWTGGWRGVPIAAGSAWMAGWWAIRAAGQMALGRRAGDLAISAWFGGLAVLHLAVAVAAR